MGANLKPFAGRMLCMPALNVVTEKIPYNNKEPSFDICGFLFVTMG